METHGDRFGAHRVLEPKGALPQAAWRVDADTGRRFDNEIVIDVATLNIDAASFRQMEEASAGEEDGIRALIRETVADRGKQHNPVTGSGGMLLGRVRAIGSRLAPSCPLGVGDRIATLVSLSLTPLRLRTIGAIRRASAQVDVEGDAILFESGPYAKIPSDLDERLALAALDVAGAAPQVTRLVEADDSVLVLGAGGKSGILCAYEARRRTGKGRVIGVESYEPAARELEALGLCDAVIVCDGRDALDVRRRVIDANGGRDVDKAISCVNVDGAEMSAILSVRDRGRILFFAMSTSFTRAALGAEGVGRDVDMIIGNGFAVGHAEQTLDVLRDSSAIRELFTRRYAR